VIALSVLVALGTACRAPVPEQRSDPDTAAASRDRIAPRHEPAAPSPSWLDRPLVHWNSTGPSLPAAPVPDEPRADILSRCRLTPPATSAAERAVATAGWIPFLPGGQRTVRDDAEVVGGMSGADGMCRPVTYNLFVFVRGKFAGTLSPVPMMSREDGASGAVTLTPAGLDVEFARYQSSDPLCCPSGRVQVAYRIDRSETPSVVPITATPVSSP
jgi:hypothetical protein